MAARWGGDVAHTLTCARELFLHIMCMRAGALWLGFAFKGILTAAGLWKHSAKGDQMAVSLDAGRGWRA